MNGMSSQAVHVATGAGIMGIGIGAALVSREPVVVFFAIALGVVGLVIININAVQP